MSVAAAIDRAYAVVRDLGQRVEPSRWQSTDVSKRAEATTYEVLNHTIQFQVPTEDLAALAAEIRPNLPWADDHFLERVGGAPLNPGDQWAKWPWANKADHFRHENVVGQGKGFSHTYMERMWPKHANTAVGAQGVGVLRAMSSESATRGVRYRYGDASDVVSHLVAHPDSRQAYLPIWFPEDTGKTDVRVPCTLGYHLIYRRGFLHCTYYIRSCDVYRHLRDDVYLSVRLQLWMLDQLRDLQADRDVAGEPPRSVTGAHDWWKVKPGLFTMHVVSLHAFVNDCVRMWPGWKPR